MESSRTRYLFARSSMLAAGADLGTATWVASPVSCEQAAISNNAATAIIRFTILSFSFVYVEADINEIVANAPAKEILPVSSITISLISVRLST
jgi:hypothetical protein